MGVAACIVLVYPLTKVSLAKLCVLSLVTQNGTGRGRHTRRRSAGHEARSPPRVVSPSHGLAVYV